MSFADERATGRKYGGSLPDCPPEASGSRTHHKSISICLLGSADPSRSSPSESLASESEGSDTVPSIDGGVLVVRHEPAVERLLTNALPTRPVSQRSLDFHPSVRAQSKNDFLPSVRARGVRGSSLRTRRPGAGSGGGRGGGWGGPAKTQFR